MENITSKANQLYMISKKSTTPNFRSPRLRGVRVTPKVWRRHPNLIIFYETTKTAINFYVCNLTEHDTNSAATAAIAAMAVIIVVMTHCQLIQVLFTYFEVNIEKDKSWIVIRDLKEVLQVHSISDNEKILSKIKKL